VLGTIGSIHDRLQGWELLKRVKSLSFRLTLSIILVSIFVVLGHAKLTKASACAPPTTDRGSMTSTLNIPSTGTYRIWSRIMSGNTSTDNSYFLEVDNTNCYIVGDNDASIPANTWTWVDYQNGTTTSKIDLSLTAGNHTIKMIGKEDAVKVDRVIAATDTSCVPTGTGDNCTPAPANLWVDANGGTCTRSATPGSYIDAQACGSFNAAWQAASPGDTIIVKTGSYGNQSLLTRAVSMTSSGVTFMVENGTVIGDINFGDQATWGAGDYKVDYITMQGNKGQYSSGTLSFANAKNITVDGDVVHNNWANKQAAFWAGHTDHTTLKNVDLGYVQDNKIMESVANDSTVATATAAGESYANANITIQDSQIHDMRRTSSAVHNECGLMAGAPGFTLMRTHWYGCTVMDFNFGAISQDNFHFVNNIFEAPTDFTESDKTGLPWFQGCNAAAPSTKPGWVFEYNIFETGWYSGGSTGCGDNGLTLRSNIGHIITCPSGTGMTIVKNIFDDLNCGGTNVQHSGLLTSANFTNISAHDWTYPSGAYQVDKGDISSYPTDDFTHATRYAGAAPDAGAYEYTGPITPPPPPPNPTPPGNITIGENTITPTDDNGNANLLLAQRANLAQSASIQSLSFYVTTASGKLRLGIYDATGPSGGPGTKLAETAELTPTAGWNTTTTTTHPTLNSGNYWLAYTTNDNNLSFKKSTTSSVNSVLYNFTYNTMPNTFPTVCNVPSSSCSTPSHWSLFATLNTSSQPKQGDINQDNSVNITDLSLLLSSYSQTTTNCITNNTYVCDIKNDTPPSTVGHIDIFDLSLLLSGYGS
jgi:hypothetical protein